MARGFFLTLEGPEGAGKTTQARLLVERLRAAGFEVHPTREPGGEPFAETVRRWLQDPATDLALRAEVLLFLAARAQHVERVVRPALEAGKVVVCDRFADSTLAYQCFGAGLPLDEVRLLNTFATEGLEPDLTLLLDVDPHVGLERQSDRARMELRALDFHQRVRDGFLALCQAHPHRIRLVDAARPELEVARDIWGVVEARLGSAVGKEIRHEARDHRHS